jgi:Bifunctional DNA primase/polymerase, N-terminal
VTRPGTELRSAALAYAARGIHVLPLHHPEARPQAARPTPAGPAPGWALGCSCGDRACGQVGKHPLGALVPHGLREATTNRARILAWWTAHPQANVGLATGHRFDVLDLDGPAGHQAVQQREAALALGTRTAVALSRENEPRPLVRLTGQDDRIATVVRAARHRQRPEWPRPERLALDQPPARERVRPRRLPARERLAPER